MLSGNLLYAQESNCKVLLPRLSGTYDGGAKMDLLMATTCQGIDRYEVNSGRVYRKSGVYRWADGTFYDGSWKKGLREGYGRMIYSSDSTVTGYWKADKYTGSRRPEI